jgi:hypothetical protein
MVTPLRGADAATPPVALPSGRFDVFGFYIGGDISYRWTQANVKHLAELGVKGALPIVVPSQKAGNPILSLDELVKEARAYLSGSFVKGMPLVLDVEQGQAESVKRTGLRTALCTEYASVCEKYGGFTPWIYAGMAFWDAPAFKHLNCRRWLASWAKPSGELPPASDDPKLGAWNGWQYAGNVPNVAAGRTLDYDLFDGAEHYLSTALDGKLWPPLPEAATPPVDLPDARVYLGRAAANIKTASVYLADIATDIQDALKELK